MNVTSDCRTRGCLHFATISCLTMGWIRGRVNIDMLSFVEVKRCTTYSLRSCLFATTQNECTCLKVFGNVCFICNICIQVCFCKCRLHYGMHLPESAPGLARFEHRSCRLLHTLTNFTLSATIMITIIRTNARSGFEAGQGWRFVWSLCGFVIPNLKASVQRKRN